ncbi:unnamed protein product, partial [Polarella glacialis]
MAPAQREFFGSGGPALKEPRRASEAVLRPGSASSTVLGGARAGSRSVVAPPGGQENKPQLSQRAPWGRSSPTGLKGRRPATAGAAAPVRSTATTRQSIGPAVGTNVLRDITNVTMSKTSAGKTQKSVPSARTRSEAPAWIIPDDAAPDVASVEQHAMPQVATAVRPSSAPREVVMDAVAAPVLEDLEPFAGEDGLDEQNVLDYAHTIFDHLFHEEQVALQPLPNYMEVQPEVNGKMRAILVDWLVEVHMKYKLRSETLFLTVHLIDRYLSSGPVVSRKKLQLVGVVAMFIAAKFEEIDPPTVHNFVYITDNAYTKEEILQAECSMLAVIGFDMVMPMAGQFLDRLLRAHGCDGQHKSLARYLLELSLVDVKLLRY